MSVSLKFHLSSRSTWFHLHLFPSFSTEEKHRGPLLSTTAADDFWQLCSSINHMNESWNFNLESRMQQEWGEGWVGDKKKKADSGGCFNDGPWLMRPHWLRNSGSLHAEGSITFIISRLTVNPAPGQTGSWLVIDFLWGFVWISNLLARSNRAPLGM